MIDTKTAKTVNRLFLGLVMLVPGLSKVFVMGADKITGMLTGIGFPIPSVFAWILIIAEISTGAAILANWKVKYAYLPPVVILVIAALTVNWFTSQTGAPNWSQIIIHFALASNFLVIGAAAKKKS
jgi:uncharacterized membrane protein YphA (DoxX/SURF4 family)